MSIINGVGRVGIRNFVSSTPTYPTSLKLFIDAGNPLSYPGTGTTVTDLIGTQNGTLINGTGWSSSNGGTFTFDGVNDYISFPTNSANLTGDFSISIAFNSAINNGNFVLFTNYLYSGGLNYGYKIALRDDNVIRFAIYNGGSGALNLISTTTYSPNVWYHVVITRKSGNRTRMYINGVINSSDTNTINPVYIGTNYPTVGVSQYQSGVFEQYSNAKIQEIGIFDKELTESEVLADFNQFKSRYGY